MSPRLSMRLAVCTLGTMLLASGTACAAKRTTTVEAPAAQIASPVASGNTVDELRQLMDSGQLTELRTTYNGNYGASLLFNTGTLTYYVALFQDKDFWRVIKTDSNENAEGLYKTFVEQTQQLAQVYIDTIRLQAGKQYTERLVAENERRLSGLQQEVDQQRQQSLQVSATLQQAKQQAVALSSDLRATNSQLDALNSRIEALKAIQDNPQLSLPEPQQSQQAPQVAPAAPVPATLQQP